MGLPLLNAMGGRKLLAATSASVEAAAAGSPIRMAWVFFPNGTNAAKWLPDGNESEWQLTPSLEPLAELKSDFSVLRGLAQYNAAALGDGPGDHARSAAAFLTGAHPFKTAGSKIRVGRSVDQVAADVYGRHTRLASIELGTEQGRGAGACDSGYACVYSNNISWRSENQPMAKEIRPRMAFERLFGSGKQLDEEARRRQALKMSVLDSIAGQAASLRKVVGKDDQQKLDEYFSSIRDIEQRIERADKPVNFGDNPASPPDHEPADHGEHIRMMYDLMVLAFRTDTTRLATFMLANEGSNQTFPMIEVKEGHHELSHHQDDADKIAKIAKIDRFYTEQFAYFLRRMKETPDGDSNLLNNSLIVYGGAISDGNRHDHDNLPILLAGNGGGNVTSGRLIKWDGVPLNNLFLSMLDMVDVNVDRLGDSSGRLDRLKV
jgi:hypothetical protein